MTKPTLSAREKKVVVAAVACMIGIVVYFSGIKLRQNLHTSQIQLEAAQQRLSEVRTLRAAIVSERSGHQAIQELIHARGMRFDLYSFANQCIRQHALQDRAELHSTGSGSAKVDLSAVRIQLRNVSMKELTDFLYTLYDGENLIAMQQLTALRPSANNQGLDCDISFIAPKG
jgi:type II secretory pathway component PulM